MAQVRANSLPTRAATTERRTTATRTPLWKGSLEYQAGSSFFFGLMLLYVLYFYLQGGFRFEALGRIRFELILGSLLIVGSVLSLGKVKAPREKSGVVGWIIAMFAIAAVMTLVSQSFIVSWDLFLDRIIKFGMMSLFISALV